MEGQQHLQHQQINSCIMLLCILTQTYFWLLGFTGTNIHFQTNVIDMIQSHDSGDQVHMLQVKLSRCSKSTSASTPSVNLKVRGLLYDPFFHDHDESSTPLPHSCKLPDFNFHITLATSTNFGPRAGSKKLLFGILTASSQLQCKRGRGQPTIYQWLWGGIGDFFFLSFFESRVFIDNW